MPLTSKGEEIMGAMQKQYGAEKGKSVFYASKNAGKISGVDTILTDPQSLDEAPVTPAGPVGPERPAQKPYTEAASLDSLRHVGQGRSPGASSG
jgi:hypothetical protein